MLATGGYVGYLQRAPGILGSFAGLAVVWMLSTWSLPLRAAIIMGFFLVGVTTSDSAERDRGTGDPHAIVSDEIVGMVVVLLALPYHVGYVMAAFGLFRILDILKPLGLLERLPGGWGNMFDDLAAVLLTNLLLQGVHLIIMR